MSCGSDGVRDGYVLTERVVEQDVERNMLAFLAYDFEDDLYFNDVLAWSREDDEEWVVAEQAQADEEAFARDEVSE